MFAMILIFVSANLDNVNTSRVTLFPTRAACEATLPGILAYQQGKNEAWGMHVNGFCVPAVADGTTGS